MDADLTNYFKIVLFKWGLTKRQTECALWVLQGLSNEQISVLLRTKPALIKQLLTKVYLKSRVKNRAQFIVSCYALAVKEYKSIQTPIVQNSLVKGV